MYIILCYPLAIVYLGGINLQLTAGILRVYLEKFKIEYKASVLVLGRDGAALIESAALPTSSLSCSANPATIAAHKFGE